MGSDTLDRLRRVPLFADLDAEGLERLASIANEFEASAGHVLMERGQAGTGVFIIEDGSVRVEMPDDDDVILGPGEFVGELSVLADTPRTARVVVDSDMTGLAIRRQDLDDLLIEEPTIAVAMLRALARRFVGHD
ncbi:MAG TPA: Crp/Fnr family transcriptional regulator [Acidimicrobiia bacterium]|jgi:CRP-like cAMP-binding protein